MRISDAIWQLVGKETNTVFYLPGGMCGPLVDALGQSGLKAVCCIHEQGAGFAAVGYAQHHGFGVCLTTSGPGATNAVTPCLAAWMDSVPVLFISGQCMVRWMALPGMRTRGTQEGPTIEIVRPITKLVREPLDKYAALPHLKGLIDACKSPRYGPCWFSVPMDIQAADI